MCNREARCCRLLWRRQEARHCYLLLPLVVGGRPAAAAAYCGGKGRPCYLLRGRGLPLPPAVEGRLVAATASARCGAERKC